MFKATQHNIHAIPNGFQSETCVGLHVVITYIDSLKYIYIYIYIYIYVLYIRYTIDLEYHINDYWQEGRQKERQRERYKGR